MRRLPGDLLRSQRQELGLTMRDVELRSAAIARQLKRRSYFIPLSRLSEYERGKGVPSIFKLYSLAAIYQRPLIELAHWWVPDGQPGKRTRRPKNPTEAQPPSS